MKHLNCTLAGIALVILLTQIPSTVFAQKKPPARATEKRIASPIIDFDPDSGIRMILSDLWSSYDPWRFGQLDETRYFLIMSPLALYGAKTLPPWLIFIGPERRLKKLVIQGAPQFSHDGSVKFRTHQGIFNFYPPSKGLPDTFAGKAILIPNLEFGPGIPLLKKRPGLPRPDSCPAPPIPKPKAEWPTKNESVPFNKERSQFILNIEFNKS